MIDFEFIIQLTQEYKKMEINYKKHFDQFLN